MSMSGKSLKVEGLSTKNSNSATMLLEVVIQWLSGHDLRALCMLCGKILEE